MNYKETRFFNRKAHLIGFAAFTEVIQELLDDSTLQIEDYPVLSVSGDYSAHDEDEIMERIGNYLGVNIIVCVMFLDLEEIYFIEDK